MKEIQIPFTIRTEDKFCDEFCKAIFEYRVGGSGLTRCLLFDEQLYWTANPTEPGEYVCERCPKCKRAERELDYNK